VDGNFRVPVPSVPLAFTGERMTSAAEGQIEFEHYHRYCFTRDLCDGRDVLDVASGEGYGAALLAGVARSVVAVEIDSESVAHAGANYRAANLRFLQGDALALPLADGSVDVVVSFETLEHLADQNRFMAEVRRVLRPDGLFVVSTPDRSVYSAPGSDPNPYHTLELTAPEFSALLLSHYVNVTLLAQRPMLGSVLSAGRNAGWRSYERRGPDIIEATNGLARAHYLLAVATDGPMPDIGSSVYLDRRRVHDVVQDAARLPALRAQADEFLRERNVAREAAARETASLRAASAAKLARLQGEHTVSQGRLATLEQELRAVTDAHSHATAQLAAAQDNLAVLRSELDAAIYSTSWRLLAPLRAFGERFPSLARSARRLAKIVWWTVTLQIGYRIAARRRQQAVAPQIAAPEAVAAQPAEPALDLRQAFGALLARTAIDFPAVAVPVVSVIIPAYRGIEDVRTCLRSLAATLASEPAFEVILVDDCPADTVHHLIPPSSGLTKIANAENLGFLLSCNIGAQAARGRVLCFLNSDTIVMPGWLGSLVQALDSEPRAGIAGGMLLNADNTIQSAGWRILANGWGHPIGAGGDPRDGAYTYRRDTDCVTGACFAVSKALFDELGRLDELYAPAFYEEFDLAFRARALGWRVVYEPASRVVHLGSASYGAERRDQLSSANHAKFAARFAGVLSRQPEEAGDEFTVRQGAHSGPVLLVVDHGIPRPDRHAGDVTMTQYLSVFVAAGWRVVFGPKDGVADGPAAAALERQGIELIRAPMTIPQWLARHGGHVSEVWLARPEIGEAFIGAIRANSTAHIAYYPHDLHHVRLEMRARLEGGAELAEEAAQVREQECAVLREVDHIMPPSAEEAAVIRTLAPATPVTVLPPYFYDAADCRAYDAAHFEGLSDIVFVGGFPHVPNVDGAVFMATEVMPLVWRDVPQARLVLVGYAPPPEVLSLAGPRVLVTGQVPHVEPFLEQARLVLCALRYGAGVKNKVVDAMRLGVPVVATTIGGEGIGIEPGRDAMIADDAAGLARGVVDLFASAQRCAALSAAGSALVRQRFSRAAARAALRDVFRTPRCGVCGSGHLIALPASGNMREAIVCAGCESLSRTEALGRVVLGRLARDGEESLAELARGRPEARVHEFGDGGGIANTLRWQNWYSVSAQRQGTAPGSIGKDGVRCEDMTRLTFADASFDVLISQDMLKYASDPDAAFAETARVLRPGGSHVFTVPQDMRLPHSVRLARRGSGGVERGVPPDHAGDTGQQDGAVVFTEFGADLEAFVHSAGLRFVAHDVRMLGGAEDQTVRVFEAVKPPATV
jgi:GT2 family glycosyltransferase/ubiquinone/menaquinone biosynthesis C-methylase UbiE/glycosyltransferase involved in cell wall biosynthesis